MHPSDKSNLLVSTVYNCASLVPEKIGDDFVTESATEFLDSLQLDENGNLDCRSCTSTDTANQVDLNQLVNKLFKASKTIS